MTSTGAAQRLQEDLLELATYSQGGPGTSRRLFSTAYRDSREWVRRSMLDAGLTVDYDGAGNIVGVLEGANPNAGALMTGSHTDTVDGGGDFDGVVGVLGAIEVARQLREEGRRLAHDLVIVDFLGEESNDHGLTCLGSRAFVGDLTANDLERLDATGETLGERCRSNGLDPSTMLTAGRRFRRPRAYVELHIEQGPVLEERQSDIGVVTGIVGIQRLLATFTGRADHAGTTPMARRRDALVAAASAVLAVRQTGCDSHEQGVTTTSEIAGYTSGPNVVPQRTRLLAEMRSISPVWLSEAERRLTQEIIDLAATYGVHAELEWIADNEPRPMDTSIQRRIAGASEALGLTWEAIPSGATHDAVHLARKCPTAMVFVPSVGGRSHCPEESTATDDLVNGVDVLRETLVNLDSTSS
ncbi:hydantoinase/carbamoylase family amidase [Pedococcus sp. NPDC057267]|uniref:hydantoinase/carbamoylase family amidase n=1 Tax=Pedococcus sp. NPDC057267 TaxID=3346077 RepID=UPI00363071EE